MIFNTVAHTCMHSLVNTLGESHKGVWVNKKLGRMMGLSICKHILGSEEEKQNSGNWFHIQNDAV